MVKKKEKKKREKEKEIQKRKKFGFYGAEGAAFGCRWGQRRGPLFPQALNFWEKKKLLSTVSYSLS